MKRKPAIYGVCRAENDASRTHGWQVTIQRRGVIYRKLFSDGTHGGKAAALKAAKRYRDALIERHPPLRKREHAEILKRSNTSGVPGVNRYCASETRDRSPSTQRWFWVASWMRPDGRPQRKKFSIGKYGELEAFRLAVKTRRRAMRTMRGNFDPGATRIARRKSRLV